jgi:hypothetical protein
VKIVEFVEIKAARKDVFKVIVDIERRMQLSPLWGLAKARQVSGNYPAPGSSYHVVFEDDDHSLYETAITGFIPERKLAYSLVSDRTAQVTWTVQDTPRGTRLIYEEEFEPESTDIEDFQEQVKVMVGEWLANIKRYSEIGNHPLARCYRWILDRFYLRLKIEQRRMVQVLLIIQVAGIFYIVVYSVVH